MAQYISPVNFCFSHCFINCFDLLSKFIKRYAKTINKPTPYPLLLQSPWNMKMRYFFLLLSLPIFLQGKSFNFEIIKARIAIIYPPPSILPQFISTSSFLREAERHNNYTNARRFIFLNPFV